MTGKTDTSAVERLLLRQQVRALREKHGETQLQLAHAMDWSLSKLIRIERGDVAIKPGDVRELLAHYGVSDAEVIDTMTGRARAARHLPLSDLKGLYAPADLAYFGYESAAVTIQAFELSLVHGLLQTKDYAQAILADVFEEHWDTFDRRWEARERRQAIHDRATPPAVEVVLDEAVVRRVVGSRKVMREQLERLRECADLPHVDLRTLPFDAGAHQGVTGSFALIGLADDPVPDLLFKEGAHRTSTSTEDPGSIREHRTRFRALQSQALTPEDTAKLLDTLITSLT